MDLIDREALLKCLILNSDGKRIPEYDCDNFPITISLVEMKKIIRNQKKVEAVEVVRCKNCKRWGTGVAGETERVKCCELAIYMVGENGYCCYGADMRKKV